MVLLQLFWQMCQLKENFNVSNEKIYSSFTLHLNVSFAVHGRTDMKCTVNPYEKSRTNNHFTSGLYHKITTELVEYLSDTWKATTESKEYSLAQLRQAFSETGSSI